MTGMKLLVFTDTHMHRQSLEAVREQASKADLVICLGDISWFGNGIAEMLAIISTFGKEVLMLHGNHEDPQEMHELCAQHRNIHFSHKEVTHLLGYAFVTYGGGGFARKDRQFEDFGKAASFALQEDEQMVLLLHQPPHDTALDLPFDDYHSGNKSIRAFIDEAQPLLVLCGHIHECFGVQDKINKTTLLNPGPYGSIIDLELLKAGRDGAITILGEEHYRRVQ